jgi:hypothetical protein
MIGTPTKYKNNSRVISGLVNVVYDSDLILLCDTSLGAVNLTLPEIPENRFSTQYKLYVVDNSNNAVINNITITAPTGFTIQSSTTAKINANGGICIVTISSNKSYNAEFNYNESGYPIIVKNEGVSITPNASSINFVGATVEATAVGNDVTVTVTSSGNPIAVKNEGTEITPTALSLNFVGNLVNATSVAGAVQIDINSSFYSVNYSLLQTLISTNALIPNQQYLISDAIFINTIEPLNPIIKTAPIVVQAITTNEISLSGSGIFLNADYQNVGNYSGVTGFVAQKGLYDVSTAFYVVGDVIVWNNLHWKYIGTPPVLLDGGISTFDDIEIPNPSENSSIWELLPQSSTNGYITEIDIIKYNVATNRITYREDVRNNRIENNLLNYVETDEQFYFFQWGSDKCTENTVLNNSSMRIWNNLGSTKANIIKDYSFAFFSIQGLESSRQDENNISGASVLSIYNQHIFERNTLENSNLSVANFTSGTVAKNSFFNRGLGVIENRNGGDFIGNKIIENEGLIDKFIINNYASFQDNQFINYTEINVQENQGFINNNIFGQLSTFRVTTINNANIKYNRLYNSIFDFNTVNGNVLNNSLYGDNSTELQSTIRVTNVLGDKIADNILVNSIFRCKDATENDEGFCANNLTYSTVILNGDLGKSFTYNNWISVQFIITDIVTTLGRLKQTTINKGSLLLPQLTQDIIGGIQQNNISSIRYRLDMEDPTIYDVVNDTLTIPSGCVDFFGEYILFSNTPFDILKVINLSERFATRFISEANPDFPSYKRFVVTPSVPSGLQLNQLLSPNNPIATNTYYFIIDGGNGTQGWYDSIYLRNLGNYNGIEQYYRYTSVIE